MEKFDDIYSEYFSIVYRYVLALCHDKSVAEEITQEAFFKALKNIDSFDGKCKLSVWLCQIAKNTLFSSEARNRRRSEHSLDQILHNLDEPYKEVFTLRTFGELSFAQIAALFEKTESWARVTYHRAKIKIKSSGNMSSP